MGEIDNDLLLLFKNSFDINKILDPNEKMISNKISDYINFDKYT